MTKMTIINKIEQIEKELAFMKSMSESTCFDEDAANEVLDSFKL